MNEKKIAVFLAFVLLVSIMPFIVSNVKAVGVTYYVSTTGNDSNSGTIAYPWRTIQYGVNHMSGGDTLYVMNGDYNENISIYGTISGTSSQWTTITSYTHWGATINGNTKAISSTTEALFYVKNVTYLRITGFQIKNSSYKGINIHGWNTNHIKIDNNSFYNTSGSACSAMGKTNSSDMTIMAQNISIENNTCVNIENNYNAGHNGGEGISLARCKNSVIQYNTIRLCSKECINTLECRYCIVRNNIINTTHGTNFGGWENGILCDGWYKGNDHIQIYNNKVWGNGTDILIEAEQTIGFTSNISIYNNILDLNETGPVKYGIVFGLRPFTDIIISSNTIYATGIYPACADVLISCARNKNELKCINISNNIFNGPNLFYAMDFSGINRTDKCVTFSNNLYHNIGWESKTLNNWLGSDSEDLTFDSHYVDAVPLFVNQNTGNFHLNSTSPCRNNGTSLFAPSFDYENIYRPQGAGYDIGAYEYYPTSTPTGNLIETIQVIAHNLGTTPNFISITPTSYPGSYVFYYVDSITSTTFTLHILTEEGVTVSFMWKAEKI